MLKQISEKEFNKEITNKKGVCLVDFYASWCGPCIMLSPILEDIANSRVGYNIYKVDVDKNMNLASKLEIDTIPALCIYKDGKLVKKEIGYRKKEEIIDFIQEYEDDKK